MLKLVLLLSVLVTAHAGFRTHEIVPRHCYPFENVTVVSGRGYILTMHRIKHGRNNGDSIQQDRPVVFLQHGLEASSSNFVTHGPNKSLAFMLADAGFDVWMGNVRGNLYSLGVTKNLKSYDYWGFSWQHMAHEDLPAMVNRVLELTEQKSLYYVGHSQGTLMMFAKLANDTAFGSKIKKFFAMAPVGSVQHIHSDARRAMVLLNDFCNGDYKLVRSYPLKLFLLEFPPASQLLGGVMEFVCSQLPRLCVDVVYFLSGGKSRQFDEKKILNYISDMPSGTSVENMCHWAQMVSDGQVRDLDWGSPRFNRLWYGQPKPRVYDFSRISVDTYLYWSKADGLADEKDIKDFILKNYNKKYLKLNQELDDFTHLDFLWGERAPAEIYQPIIDAILEDRRGSNGSEAFYDAQCGCR